MQKEHNCYLECCVTASTNPFDEYNGQEILFLDDVRDETLGFLDWLKLLDPYCIILISTRYHNKFGAAKVIIITSPVPPYQLFNHQKFNSKEDLGQFYHRIDFWIIFSNNKLLVCNPIRDF